MYAQAGRILKLIIIIIIKNKKQNVKAPWRGAGA